METSEYSILVKNTRKQKKKLKKIIKLSRKLITNN